MTKTEIKFIKGDACSISELERKVNCFLEKGWKYIETKTAGAYSNDILVILIKEEINV